MPLSWRISGFISLLGKFQAWKVDMQRSIVFVNIKMFAVWTHDKEKRKKAISYNILSTYCNRMSVTCKKKVAKIQHTAPAWQICTDIYQFEIFCQTCFFSLGTTAFRTTCEICNLKREGWPLNPQEWLTFNLPLHQTLRPQELRIRSKLKKLLIVEWILLVSILGNLYITVWKICMGFHRLSCQKQQHCKILFSFF